MYPAIFVGASALTTLYLLSVDRTLLERRMRGGPAAEKRPAQKLIMVFTSMFIALLVVPALDQSVSNSSTLRRRAPDPWVPSS